MNADFEALHERGGDPDNRGRFSGHKNTEAAVSLPANVLPHVGERVIVGDRPGYLIGDSNGTLTVRYPNGDTSLETARSVTSVELDVEQEMYAIEVIEELETMRAMTDELTDEQAAELARVHREINDGAWRDLLDQGAVALIDAHIHKLDDRWLVETAETVGTHDVQEHRSDIQIAGRTIAQRAALALAARHLIGEVDGWTEEAYDHMTRPWRTVIGPINDGDKYIADSWAKRPID